MANGRASSPEPEDGGEYAGQQQRRLPATPIYEDGGGPFATGTMKSQPPKLLRDKLYDHMCDWDYHSLEELDGWMPEREWVRALSDLLHWGFTFDRRDGKLRLRKRRGGEGRPSIVALLAGFTLSDRLGEPLREEGSSGEEPEAGQMFSPEGDDEEVPEEERMVLDESETVVLSSTTYVTETATILARKGMGKTYLAMVVAEAFLASELGVPFVVIDPTGCWYGLLARADGTPADRAVVVFGGEHGHYGLVPSSGRIVARTVVAMRPLPAVLDLSAFSPEDQHLFAADFCEELYLRNRRAMHVIVDEADIFAPQRLDKASRHQKRCLVALDNMTRRGRFRGIGDTLVSQRAAVVNKDLLSQIGYMFLLQMIAPQDLDAVERWMHDNIPDEAKQACRADLPILPKGTAYILRGGDRPMFRRFKVRQKETFDSSHTPRMGEVAATPVLAELSPEDRALVDSVYLKELGERATEDQAEMAALTGKSDVGEAAERSREPENEEGILGNRIPRDEIPWGEDDDPGEREKS